MRLYPEDEDVHYNLGLASPGLANTMRPFSNTGGLAHIAGVRRSAQHLGNASCAREWWKRRSQNFKRPSNSLPDYASAHNNLGTALRRRADHDALVSFREAVKLSPDTGKRDSTWKQLDAKWASERGQGRVRECSASAAGFQPAQAALKQMSSRRRPGTLEAQP